MLNKIFFTTDIYSHRILNFYRVVFIFDDIFILFEILNIEKKYL
jgi:hypothetical protein